MPNQSHKRIIVPRFPGSKTESKAKENDSILKLFEDLGILKTPIILLAFVSCETLFKVDLSINL